ncbi:hypothetical protein ABZ914_04625 [Spirillospora sp. NPDC046719]
MAIDADSQLVVMAGRPVPGKYNGCTACRNAGAEQGMRGARVTADDGYQGNR